MQAERELPTCGALPSGIGVSFTGCGLQFEGRIVMM